MPTALRLWEVEVRFRRPLETAHGTVTSRRSVILALDDEGATGWAEAPAFPSGRFGTAEEAFEDLAAPFSWAGGLPAVPIARAAVEAARADAAARRGAVPLHRHVGASGEPVPARHPLGLLTAADAGRTAAWLQSHGIVAIKLKVEPGRDTGPAAALRAAMPRLDIGVDANGAYDDPDDPGLRALDELDVSFVEQPFAAGDLKSHARLRSAVRMAVCLDESVPDRASVERALAAGAADQVAVKLNRVGWTTLGEILDVCGSEGIGVQIGGTFDTSIGRRHLLAAATIPGVVDAAVGPPAAYLAAELAPYPAVVGGTVRPDESPGIGIEPDVDLLTRSASRTAVIG